MIATCLGILRDARLDCLPQLLSFVATSLARRCLSSMTSIALDMSLRSARAGWPRPSDRSEIVDSESRNVLDRYFVHRWSIWLDLALLANSVAAVRNAICKPFPLHFDRRPKICP
jgi:lipopolysaccharide/colanic/teichoic acid biosynthesis glycosyltransferase